MFIILDVNQAGHVRGATAEGAALYPAPLANGTEWVLPVRVLTDPRHAVYHAYLDALPQREVTADEFPQPEPLEGE
jgi:hypothetical protein